MKKKVLVINTKYTTFGGEDANIQQELDMLKNEFDTRYLEFNNQKFLTLYDLASFFTGSNYRSNNKLKQYLSEFKPDIVYVHNTWYKAGLGIFKILQKKNIKTVLKIHNFRYDCTRYFLAKNHVGQSVVCQKCGYKINKNAFFNKYYKDSYLKSFFVILYGKKYFKVLNYTRIKIIVLNNFHKNFLEKAGVNGQIDIVYNPLNIKFSQENKYNSKSYNIVYAGQVSKQKGVDMLIEVWKKFSSGSLVLNIIGPLVDIELPRQNELNNINILGEKNNTETLNIISQSRAVITTTKMYEGQPRLLSEASILGIPSIYPSFGGMDEYFPKDYFLSYLQYDYQDLLKKLNHLHDEELLNRTSKKLEENYKSKFNNEIILKKISEVFDL
jgi:glycosyltransferase involved in cell wall biosynthesis